MSAFALQTASAGLRRPARRRRVGLHADIAGVLYWPEQGLLAVADLHLEKGSSFAERGVLLPPYDTAATLARLDALIARYAPRVVIALGDSFHDGRGPARLADTDRARCSACSAAATGSGSPAITIRSRPRTSADGFSTMLKVGALTFRHEPEAAGRRRDRRPPASGRAGGAAAAARSAAAASPATACGMVMPAFGAYTGGLNVRDRAFANVFPTLAFTAHMLGEQRVYAVAAKHCLPD